MTTEAKKQPEALTEEVFLAEPSVRYKESYLDAAHEFLDIGAFDQGTYAYSLGFNMQTLVEQFPSYVEKVLSLSDKSVLPPGRCPSKMYWLIVNNEYAGKVSIRLELNDYLRAYGGHIGYNIRPSRRRRGYGTMVLRLALEKSRELGLKRVLVTCDDDNIASKKIIERNGGEFESSIPHDSITSKRKLRYWFDL